jgi:hemerythrin-like domain-containing protein
MAAVTRPSTATGRRAARPPRAPAPPLPGFEALDRTHRRVLELLDQFDRLLVHVDAHGIDDAARAIATEIHAFFSTEGHQHHADEERLVFPSLLNSPDATLVQHVQRLQQDHGWLEEDWLELAPHLEAISTGYNWYDLAMLRAALPVFRALYEEHIGLEESLIYPAARARQQALADGAVQRHATTGAAPSSA